MPRPWCTSLARPSACLFQTSALRRTGNENRTQPPPPLGTPPLHHQQRSTFLHQGAVASHRHTVLFRQDKRIRRGRGWSPLHSMQKSYPSLQRRVWKQNAYTSCDSIPRPPPPMSAAQRTFFPLLSRLPHLILSPRSVWSLCYRYSKAD